MEENINIAKILKDKPRGTKLYSTVHGKCSFEGVTDEIFKINFCTSKFGLTQTGECTLIKFGNMFDGGECIVFPSREMRDWDKFSWKILVNSSGFKLFFDRWANDDYTRFFGKVNILEDSFSYETEKYTLASKEETLDTLEIEKPEFKDGDVVCISGMGYLAYGIVKSINNSSKKMEYYVLNDMSTLKFEDWLSFEDKQIKPITETQQIILFDALAKKGKAWDSYKKAIVDLKPKCEFKPFDRCIWKIRNCEGSIWQASFVSYVDEYGASPMGMSIDEDLVNLIILPYNDKTKLLVGTTDGWKGGEQ